MENATEPGRSGVARRIERERAEDFVADWVFPIPMPAFQASINVERSERAETKKGADGKKSRRTWHVWSQLWEPRWSFVQGDAFHAPAAPPGPWSVQLQTLQWTVQVKKVLDRTMTIAVTQHREARRTEHDVPMSICSL